MTNYQKLNEIAGIKTSRNGSAIVNEYIFSLLVVPVTSGPDRSDALLNTWQSMC